MIRTSLFLPEALHQDLLITARQEGSSLTELVRDLLDQAVAKRRKGQVKRMYTVLKTLRGKGRPDVADASSTIDEVLYGEQGA
jgi:hypothetical protein